MTARLILFLGFLLASGTVTARPLVVAYERFHRERPSAAGGALLFSELGCANCHGDSPVAAPRRGPRLIGLPDRIDHRWLLDFLKDPGASREGSTMPGLTHGLEGDEVKAIAAFLGTLGERVRFPAARHANAERGRALYHDLGCVACHAPNAPAGASAPGPAALAVPFPDLAKKTSLAALHQFLFDPARFRPDGRMPRIDLAPQEAMDLAAHLLDFQASDPREAPLVAKWPASDEALVDKGRKLVRTLNCAACHDLPGEEPAGLTALASGAGSGGAGCLSPDPVAGIPYYPLTPGQRESLQQFLVARAAPGSVTNEAITLTTTLQALNCLACHERDGAGGPTATAGPFFSGDEDLGGAGRLPPPLTGVGAKLKTTWLERVLKGDPHTRVRPYLQTRMPNYSGQAATLASLFEKVDRKDGVPLAGVGGDRALEAGRLLLGTRGGAGCITCHSWGEQASLGIPGPDLSALDERLRWPWFNEYLRDPAAFRPGTLMPSFWPEGRANIPDVLGGDTDRQIAAIWAFIENGEGLPEGFPDTRTGKYELIPEERPIIQRTFFEEGGTKAILVGFPGGIHLAYDGHGAHPSLLWKGRFFDAYHTWFTRAAPFGEPLGGEVAKFPEPEGKRRFRGYRLEESGNPVFLFDWGGNRVEERFEVKGGRMHRTLSWTGDVPPTVTHPEGARISKTLTAETMNLVYSWD